MGRPSKLTSKRIDEIAQSVRSGAFIETAAAFAGITSATLREWMRNRARLRVRIEESTDDEGPIRLIGKEKLLYRFSIEMEKALAASEMRHVLNIAKHCESEWTASAWWLERRYPDRWGRRNRIDLGGVEGAAPINLGAEVGLVLKVVQANDAPMTAIPAPEEALAITVPGSAISGTVAADGSDFGTGPGADPGRSAGPDFGTIPHDGRT